MNTAGTPLARQMDFVFRQLEKEIMDNDSGTIEVHIRNNMIGKFGLRSHTMEIRDGKLGEKSKGMSPSQLQAFRKMAIDALDVRRSWTHGEIIYDYSVKPSTNTWSASVLYESNYNMSAWNYHTPMRKQMLRENS